MGRTSSKKEASTKKLEDNEEYLKRIKSMKEPFEDSKAEAMNVLEEQAPKTAKYIQALDQKAVPSPPKEEPLPPKPYDTPVPIIWPAPVVQAKPAPMVAPIHKDKPTDIQIGTKVIEYANMIYAKEPGATISPHARNEWLTEYFTSNGFDVTDLQDRLARRFHLGPYA